MPRIERICPECGASNSFVRAQCVKCRAPLATANRAPAAALFSRRGMAALAWRATKFLARTGLSLAVRGTRRGLERMQTGRREDVKGEMIEGEYRVPHDESVAAGETRAPLRDWRVWSATEGGESPGTRRVDWGRGTPPKTPKR
jgi:hypothetical protein